MFSFHNLLNLKNSNGTISKVRAASAAALSSVLVALTAPAMPAHAEQVETVKYAQSGNWAIYADSAGGCFSMTQFSRGTVIKIGFYSQGGNVQPYMMVFGPRVSGAIQGQKYRARAVFDNWNSFQGVATGGRTQGGYAYLEMNLTTEFVAAFAKHNDMAIEVSGDTVTSLPLAGTYAALLQTISCQQEFSAQAAKAPSQSATGTSRATPARARTSQF